MVHLVAHSLSDLSTESMMMIYFVKVVGVAKDFSKLYASQLDGSLILTYLFGKAFIALVMSEFRDEKKEEDRSRLSN